MKGLKKIGLILMSIIPESILDACLTPVCPFIVINFLPYEPTGKYTALITTAVYVPLLLTSYVWGLYADKVSKKHILLLFILIGTISTIMIGTSKSFTVLYLSRFLMGLFGSGSTIVKSLIGEEFADELGWGYSIYGSVYGITGILGLLWAFC
jgi:MFS family permease